MPELHRSWCASLEDAFAPCNCEAEWTSCRNPGPKGCQTCDYCAQWGDEEYHRRKEYLDSFDWGDDGYE